MKEVLVKLGPRSYAITIGKGVINQLSKGLKQRFTSTKVVILTNTTIYKLYRDVLEKKLSKSHLLSWIVVPDGEKYKRLETLQRIYTQLTKIKADRKTPLIAFGGGVIGDMGGFAAATYLRGIPFIQIPTTLLSQVDSSVGGKTGVDLPEGKNLVGAFYQPQWVLIDTNFLNTLPKRELLCGLSEVIKYGLLWDAKFYNFLKDNNNKILKLNAAAMESIIHRSCEIKAEIVSKDEKETKGLRALLNLGHTLGHAIETLSGYQKIQHGEAVSMGMVFAAILSYKLGHLSLKEVDDIISTLQKFHLPTQWPRLNKQKLAKTISLDKKAEASLVNFVLLKKIGRAFTQKLAPQKIVEYT